MTERQGKPTITIDELSRLVAERNAREAAEQEQLRRDRDRGPSRARPHRHLNGSRRGLTPDVGGER